MLVTILTGISEGGINRNMYIVHVLNMLNCSLFALLPGPGLLDTDRERERASEVFKSPSIFHFFFLYLFLYAIFFD